MTQFHDLVGAYAVDALDESQRAEFERHLAQCAACADELADFYEVLGSVADTQAVVPPAEVWHSVQGRIDGSAGEASGIERSAANSAGLASTAEPQRPDDVPTGVGERERSRPALRWLAAAAVAAVLFVGGVLVGRQTMPVQPVAADAASASVLEVAAAGDANFTDVDLMGSQSRVVTSGEMDKSVFLASDLPTPAKGMCYQVWRVNEDGSKQSAGVFVPDEQGHVAVVLDGGADVESYVITLEPPGGSKEPTGDMVAQVGA